MRKLIEKSAFECFVAVSLMAVACTGDLGGIAVNSSTEGGEGIEPGTKILHSPKDPGFKGIHRLNSREYDNTVRDLLGTRIQPGAELLNETGHGFDNVARSLGMTSSQYTTYFRVAGDIAEDVFATPELRDAVMTCDTGAPNDTCATEIISTFGVRAFRRPIHQAEVETYLKVYQRAVDLELTHAEATEQVVRAMLSSAEFLYRMEFDEDPDSAEPHPVSSYEMASRLSYFLWSTMPTRQLLEMAENNQLVPGEYLDAVVDAMLKDRRAETLVSGFAWQWLGMRDLESHAVLTDVVPEWNESVRGDMLAEGRGYLQSFILEGRSWSEFLTAEVQTTPAELGALYGGTAESRFGFLGLGGFLTVSSFAHRTSPTFRAKWILEELLCDPPQPPPPGITDLEGAGDVVDNANAAAELENVRARLELHRSDPGCSGCHDSMDPLGMALENFDAIGRYRDEYTNGDAIDPQGEMPDGTAFDGLPSLAFALAEDERFAACTAEKAFTYGLGRGLEDNDEGHVESIVERWQGEEDPTFAGLVKNLINSVPFQQRRGGSE